jgi:hypothetical protein
MSPRTWAACRNPVFDHGGSVRPPPPIPIPNSHPARALCSALLILLVAAVLPSPAHAVQYKASIAGNASTLNSVPAGWTTEDGTGFSVGMDFQFQKGILFFQPGVHYEQLGFRLEEPAGPTADDMKLTGFDVPLLVGARFKLFGALGAHAGVGPGFTFISDVEENNFGLTKGDLASTLVSGRVAAGVDVLFIDVEVSYALGFTELFKDTNTYGDGNLDTWRLKLGLGF